MEAFAEIAKFFKAQYPLHEQGLDDLLSYFVTKKYPKGTRILESGQHVHQLRFLNTGVVREYYRTQDSESNINFFTKPQFITDLTAFMDEAITMRNQECLTNVELFAIPRKQFMALLDKYECGKSLIELSFQKLLKSKERLEFNQRTKTPDELYLDLFEFKPDWLKVVPQYHIASYLNVTPETLSRIRKRIS